MVIKTEPCSFSEYRIFPGHGRKYIRKDGSIYHLITGKCRSLFLQRKKAAKLTWTRTWRRLNKKGISEDSARKRTRRTIKFQRAVVGSSLDEIKKKRSQKPEFRAAAREAALREVKERKAAKAAAAKATKVNAPSKNTLPVAKKVKAPKMKATSR